MNYLENILLNNMEFKIVAERDVFKIHSLLYHLRNMFESFNAISEETSIGNNVK